MLKPLREAQRSTLTAGTTTLSVYALMSVRVSGHTVKRNVIYVLYQLLKKTSVNIATIMQPRPNPYA
jgi:hypothetical protein